MRQPWGGSDSSYENGTSFEAFLASGTYYWVGVRGRSLDKEV